MNANNFMRRRSCAAGKSLIVAALLALFPFCAAKAEGAATAMYGVKEILVHYPRINNPDAAGFCGLAHVDLLAGMIKSLKAYNIPIFPPLEAMPPQIGIPRIELWPEIYTLNNEGVGCTSWIAMTARTENDLVIPPINIPRSVVVTYWDKGTMVTSSENQHMRVVSAAVIKLGEEFANRYVSDQPATTPALTDKK